MPPLSLAQDPGRLHACRLLPRFIGMDCRLATDRIKRRLGLRRLLALIPDAYRLPDSRLAQQALELVRDLSADAMLNHCYRTYAFGCILAHQDGLRFDREIFFLAAIMHDLGLTDRHADQPGSFEYVGAQIAYDFCTSQGCDDVKAALVHDAIALHAAVGVAHKKEPEVALVHFGAGVDVIGIRLDEIPRDALAKVLDAYPRNDFKNVMSDIMNHQAATKPQSHIAGHMGLGFESKIRGAPFAE